MPSDCERGGGVKIQSLNEKNRSSSVRVCASPPLKPVPLHLCLLLNFHWASAATKPICPSTYLAHFAFGHDSGFKIDCTLYNISSWFKGMLMLENFCHIITLLTSSSVILCWFWSLQITGKRTNNLLVTKLFNWAWLSAAPGSCWCCQLIFCSIQLIWNANQCWDGSPADSLCLSAAQLILSEVDAWPASASGPLRTSCFRPTLH